MGILAGYLIRWIVRDRPTDGAPLTRCPRCGGQLIPTTDTTRRVVCLACGWPMVKR